VLYRRDWHEPLTDRAWDEAWVRDAVERVVRDTADAWDADEFWPANEWDAYMAELPLKDLYSGASGVVWALARLGADFDVVAAAGRVHERFRERPTQFGGAELPAQARSSLFNGETGIALVRYLLAPSDDVRDVLAELIRANLDNDVNELMWGVPGTLLAARAIGARELVQESEAALLAARDDDGWWTQHLYGHVERILGPIHGLLGNAFALGDLEATVPMLRELAVRENGHVNWPPSPTDAKLRLQWCHGAPGVITTAAAQLDHDLLVGGAQLIWDAGPADRVEKNAGICHGTAGNGYALLLTFERTQDELWLDRARAFAVHALEQVRALPPRHSLFTGGIGAALFARDVLGARASFPVLDWV
jgi:hypothetical protein